MKALYAALIGVVALLMVAHLALAGPPSWDDQINKPSRFKVLKEFNNEAVLDKETGLVWEQSPEEGFKSNPTPPQAWLSAQFSCITRTVGGRKGWRLPTIQELASLVEPTQVNPALPAGHPFSNVLSSSYWSATTFFPSHTGTAWDFEVTTGDMVDVDKTDTLHVWCVRGEWDKQINHPNRFKVLEDFAGAAVLDRETGLVWEQSPEGSKSNPTPPQAWLSAQFSCITRMVGGRKGWRLPTIQELASLVDPTQSSPALPSGHPFSNVLSSAYWSATTLANSTSNALSTEMVEGEVGDDGDRRFTNHVWCVRGGQGVDPQ